MEPAELPGRSRAGPGNRPLITLAPLPEPGMLLRAALGRDADLPAALRIPGMEHSWLARTSFSFAALARAGNRRRWLVPAWFCNQSLRPLRDTGAAIGFYPVDKSGAPDWQRLEAMQGDALLIVHTLGHLVDTGPARVWCDRQGALLVEDGAHLLQPGGAGTRADAFCLSPHKLLATPDGALLYLREPTQSLDGDSPPAAWLAKRLVQRLLPDACRKHMPAHPLARFEDDPLEQPAPPMKAAGPFSRRLIARSDFAAVAAARQTNWRALAEALAGLADAVPAAAPSVPYRFALACASPERAAALYAILRDRRLPAESWPDMPPEVLARPAEFAAAIALRRTMLYLPVHQSLPAGFAERYRAALMR